MKGVHHRLYQISQSVKEDPLGIALIDEVLATCFDFTLGNGDALERLVMALNRLNQHLLGYGEPTASGLFSGTSKEVSLWAEQQTEEILANGVQ